MKVRDAAKELIWSIIMLAVFLAYWFAMLMLASFMTMSMIHWEFKVICVLSVVLGVLSWIIYQIVTIRKKRRDEAILRKYRE